MRSDPRHLVVLGGVSLVGLGLHRVGLLREVVVVFVLAAAAHLMLSRTERVE